MPAVRGRHPHRLPRRRHREHAGRQACRRGEVPRRETDARGGDRAGPGRAPARAVCERLRLPARHVPGAGRRVRAARRQRLRAAGADVPRRAAVPPARDRQEVLARHVALQGQAGHVQRPRVRPAAAGTGRVPLRHPGPRLLPDSRNRYQRPDRPDGLVHQLRRVPPGRRAQPAREAARQAGQDGGDRRQVYQMYLEGKSRRSTTTACATRSTPTSSSCARGS